MPNYITITEARIALKGSIITKVIGVGEVTSGEGTNGKWEKQIATLKDNSGTQQITLWNDDIGKLDQGQFIKLENPFWNTYKDEPQLSLGKFCTIHLANEDDLINSETPEESATLQENPKIDDKPLDELEKFALKQNSIISKISKVVRTELSKEQDKTDPVRGDVVWVRTKEIYNLWRSKND